MLSTLMSLAQPLAGRTLYALFAWQGLPASTGGGGAAHAPAGGGSAAAQGAGGLMTQLPFIVAIGAFLYFVMIRPMGKQRKEQEQLQKALVKGDKVVTTSGIVATISGVDDQFVTLEISERVRVKFLREAIARKFEPATAASRAASTSTAKPADANK